VFPDVRLKAGRGFGLAGASGYDPGGLHHNSQGLLLNIIGNDPLTLGRKMIGPWEGQLRLKLMLISNEVPNFNDVTGALPSRFIKLHFGVSFFDREDTSLLGKLEAELPGIAARCVAAYQRLCDRGRFIQPASGKALDRAVIAHSNPFAAFIFDTYRFNPEYPGTSNKRIHSALGSWCGANGRVELFNTTPDNKIGEALIAVEGFARTKLWRPNDPATGKQGPRVWYGVEPLPKER
jgi:putative DNA primase/helicase